MCGVPQPDSFNRLDESGEREAKRERIVSRGKREERLERERERERDEEKGKRRRRREERLNGFTGDETARSDSPFLFLTLLTLVSVVFSLSIPPSCHPNSPRGIPSDSTITPPRFPHPGPCGRASWFQRHQLCGGAK